MNLKVKLIALSTIFFYSFSSQAINCKHLFIDPIGVAKEYIDQIKESEKNLGVTLFHTTTPYIHKNSKGQFIRKKVMIGALHGLLNSPRYLQALSESLYFSDKNILNTRLAGHFEGKRDNLDKVNYKEWFSGAQKVLQISQGLGERTILLGHSTGALSMAYAALSNPASVDGLILLSPAFKTTKRVQRQSSLSRLGVSGNTIDTVRSVLGIVPTDPRYMSTYAGVEVNKGIKDFDEAFANLSPEKKRIFLSIPTLAIDTAIDNVVDINATSNLMSQMTNPLSQHIILDEELQIPHNNTPSGNKYTLPNPDYSLIYNAINAFITEISNGE